MNADAALQQLNYILGCNSLNLSFASGYGPNAVKDTHQSINSYDTPSLAPPGFIPGGPNRYPQDPFLTTLISAHHPFRPNVMSINAELMPVRKVVPDIIQALSCCQAFSPGLASMNSKA
jgi:hypothetical protein